MTDSQDWWPADFGHYGGLIIRMAWHGAGTYRIADGRGGAGSGQQRFAPLNSWPDNANLDKARRLLWPIKQKYGRKISWADLMVLAGNVALKSMGFKTFGFGGGRADVWEPEELYWGPEGTWLGDERYSGERELENPLAAVQMGLIYVNPEGPNGKPDPVRGQGHPRDVPPHGDERRGDRRADRRRPHFRQDPRRRRSVDRRPGAGRCRHRGQGLGWRSRHGTGFGEDAITGGPEVTWSQTPTQWSNHFLDNLFKYEWELTKSPAGAQQWKAKNAEATIPGRPRPVEEAAPTMLTTDLSLRFDPAYEKISRRFYEHPDQFADAFARAWFKLTHRDMGPIAALSRPAGSEGAPAVAGPGSRGRSSAGRRAGHRGAQGEDPRLRPVGFPTGVDGLGVGVDLPRLRQARRSERRAHSPRAAEGLGGQSAGPARERAAEARRRSRRSSTRRASGGKKVSLADLIVLGGGAAIEKRRRRPGIEVKVPFTPGRMDASQEQTDVESFRRSNRRPTASATITSAASSSWRRRKQLVDKAQLLTLTAPEMTVLVGGLRVLGANAGQVKHGVFTTRPGTLTNDFFVNLLDMHTEWQPAAGPKASTRGATGRRGAQMDRHPGRPDLRFAIATARAGGSLCVRGREGEVREGLRRGMDQGDEPDRFDLA